MGLFKAIGDWTKKAAKDVGKAAETIGRETVDFFGSAAKQTGDVISGRDTLKQGVRQLGKDAGDVLRPFGLEDEADAFVEYAVDNPVKAGAMILGASWSGGFVGPWTMYGVGKDHKEGKDPVKGYLSRMSKAASVAGGIQAAQNAGIDFSSPKSAADSGMEYVNEEVDDLIGAGNDLGGEILKTANEMDAGDALAAIGDLEDHMKAIDWDRAAKHAAEQYDSPEEAAAHAKEARRIRGRYDRGDIDAEQAAHEGAQAADYYTRPAEEVDASLPRDPNPDVDERGRDAGEWGQPQPVGGRRPRGVASGYEQQARSETFTL